MDWAKGKPIEFVEMLSNKQTHISSPPIKKLKKKNTLSLTLFLGT